MLYKKITFQKAISNIYKDKDDDAREHKNNQ